MKDFRVVLIIFIGFFHSYFVCSKSFDDEVFHEAGSFFSWLEKHKEDFSKCEPIFEKNFYILCDGTRISKNDLKRWFSESLEQMIKTINNKGVKLEVFCDLSSKNENALKKLCTPSSERKIFKEMTSLHGQYLPLEKTILLKSSASLGSLIHEYLHHLQYANTYPVYGKVYKRDRMKIQKKLIQIMDQKILEIQKMGERGNNINVKPGLETFMKAAELVRNFSTFQDLIDEKNIFLLFVKYGNEFGVSSDDIQLAKKNLGFICNKPGLSLPQSQCPSNEQSKN